MASELKDARAKSQVALFTWVFGAQAVSYLCVFCLTSFGERQGSGEWTISSTYLRCEDACIQLASCIGLSNEYARRTEGHSSEDTTMSCPPT